MKRLKLSGSQWAGYTGTIGTVDFKDGVSAYPVPRNIADRLSAAIRMVEIDDEGNEIGPAGIANRLIRDSAMRAPVTSALARQTESERKSEDLRETLKAQRSPAETFYTIEELQAIADKDGIKGLRKVAEPWGVKGKAIPAIIKMILDAQSSFVASRDGIIHAFAGNEEPPAEKADVDNTTSDVIVEGDSNVEKPVGDDILAAAMTGDLGAAINAEPQKSGDEENKTPDAEPVGDFVNSAAVLALQHKG